MRKRWLLIPLLLLPATAIADSDVPSLTAGTSLTNTVIYGAQGGTLDRKFGISTSYFDVSGGAIILKSGLTISSPTLSGTVTFSGLTGTLQCLHVDTNGQLSGTGVDCGAGGGGTPGGSSGDLQYNNAGSFGGVTLTDGQLAVGQTGAAPLAKSVTGDASLAASGALTVSTLAGQSPGPYFSATNVVNAITSGATDTLASITSPLTTQIWLSATASAKTQNIPACGASVNGYTLTVIDGQKTAGTYAITVAPASGTINGGSTYSLSSNAAGISFRCYGAGTDWQVISASPLGATVRTASGTTLTVAATDNGGVIQQSNGSSVAATIAQANSAGFPNGQYSTLIQNLGAGLVTLTPTTSTINGASTITIPQNTSLFLFSWAGNYYGIRASDITGGVSNAQLSTMAAHTYKGNNTGLTANPQDVSSTDLTADLNVLVGDSGSGGTKGLAPAPAAGDAAAAKFLKADGTWATPSGAGTVTSVALAPGFALTPGTQNTGSDAITSSGTINSQIWPTAKTTNYTVQAADAGNMLLANGSGITFTLPNPTSSTGVAGSTGVSYYFGSISANSYTLTTVGGTATFLGFANDGATSITIAQKSAISCVSNGTNYDCTLVVGTWSGDVTQALTGATTIAAAAVTNAKMANMTQTTIKCRVTASTGAPEDCSDTQATTIIKALVGDSGSGGTKGLAPAPSAGDAAAGKFLKADATWAVPSGGGSGCVPGGSAGQILTDDGAGGCTANSGFTISGGVLTVGTTLGTVATPTITANAYTAAAGDCGKLLKITNSNTAVTITLPNSLLAGCNIAWEQMDTAQITFQAGSGATLRSAHSYTKTFGQYAIVGTTVDGNSGGSAAIYVLTGDGAS